MDDLALRSLSCRSESCPRPSTTENNSLEIIHSLIFLIVAKRQIGLEENDSSGSLPALGDSTNFTFHHVKSAYWTFSMLPRLEDLLSLILLQISTFHLWWGVSKNPEYTSLKGEINPVVEHLICAVGLPDPLCLEILTWIGTNFGPNGQTLNYIILHGVLSPSVSKNTMPNFCPQICSCGVSNKWPGLVLYNAGLSFRFRCKGRGVRDKKIQLWSQFHSKNLSKPDRCWT